MRAHGRCLSRPKPAISAGIALTAIIDATKKPSPAGRSDRITGTSDSWAAAVLIAAYRRFVLTGIDTELDVGNELSRSSVLGDESFRRAVQERIGRESRSREHPRRELRVCRPSVQEVFEAAAAVFDEETSQIARPGCHPARRAVALVAHEDGLRSLREIGEGLNVSAPAVSQLIKRARKSRDRDPLFEEKLSRMRQRAAENFRLKT